MSSPDGNAVAYAANGAFGDAATNTVGGYYIGRRTNTGWSIDPIDPPQSNPSGAIWQPSLYLSADLAWAVQYSEAALTQRAVSNGGNLYRRDNQTGERSLLVGSNEREALAQLAITGARPLPAATPDLSHFVFISRGAITSDGDPAHVNVYETVDGTLRLVNRLPDGRPTPDGAQIDTVVNGARVISADGRRVFFRDSDSVEGVLYMRVDGRTTVPVSVSRRTGEVGDLKPATLIGSSSDGSVVYFSSTDFLTNVDKNGIYRFDFATDRLSLIAADLSMDLFGIPLPFSGTTSGVSADGSTLFIDSANIYTPEAVLFGSNHYMYHDGQLSFIGTGSGSDAGVPVASLSANARYYAFVSNEPLTGQDNGGLYAVFLLDTETRRLDCVSCGAPGDAHAASITANNVFISRYVPRAALDDGSVFFSTAARLVPEDVNGRQDVYQWKGETLTLISTGRGSADALFQEATPDGRSVFFTTNARLVGIDRDEDVDLYAARLGGGISSQNPSPVPNIACAEDACQGVPTSEVAPSVIGSAIFDGPGDSSDRSPVPARRSFGASARGRQRGTSIIATLTVPGGGTIRWSGRLIRSANRKVKGAGRVTVRMNLTRSARQRLRRARVLTVITTVTFTRNVGAAVKRTVVVTVRA